MSRRLLSYIVVVLQALVLSSQAIAAVSVARPCDEMEMASSPQPASLAAPEDHCASAQHHADTTTSRSQTGNDGHDCRNACALACALTGAMLPAMLVAPESIPMHMGSRPPAGGDPVDAHRQPLLRPPAIA